MNVVRWIVSGFGFLWAFLGASCFFGMDFKPGNELAISFGLILYGCFFVLPGLLLGVVSMPKNSK